MSYNTACFQLLRKDAPRWQVGRNRLFSLLSVLLLGFAPALAQSRSTNVDTPAQFRSITVVTEPRSIVWLDGVRYGRTDTSGKLEIKTVSTGSHTLRVRSDGFKDKTQPLTATQKGEIRVDLVKTTDEAELA